MSRVNKRATKFPVASTKGYNPMALLRNRHVTLLGPSGDAASPIYTVMYDDGNREDTPLKFVTLSDSEAKEFEKTVPTLTNHPKTISDKEHQDILDSQNPDKIRKRQEKQPNDAPVQVPVFVQPSMVQNAPPANVPTPTPADTVNPVERVRENNSQDNRK